MRNKVLKRLVAIVCVAALLPLGNFGPKAVSEVEASEATGYNKITLSDIADVESTSEQFSYSIENAGLTSWDGVMFSAYVAFAGGSAIVLGHDGNVNEWNRGIWAYNNGANTMDINYRPNLGGVDSFSGGFGLTGFGVANASDKFLMQVTVDFVDHAGDGDKNDIRLGVYINGMMVNKTFFYLDNQATNMTDLYLGSIGGITVESYVAPEEQPTAVREFTIDEATANKAIDAEALFQPGYDWQDKRIFRAWVTTYAGTAIAFENDGSSTVAGLWAYFNGSSAMNVSDWNGDVIGDTGMVWGDANAVDLGLTSIANNRFLLEISSEYIDYDNGGIKNDLKFDIYINGVSISGNNSMYVENVGGYLGTGYAILGGISIEPYVEEEPAELNALTLADFGMVDITEPEGFYTNVEATEAGTFENVLFSTYATFDASSFIALGGYGTDYAQGIVIWPGSADSLSVYDWTGALTGTNRKVTFISDVRPQQVGCNSFWGEQILIQVSMELVDIQGSGYAEDIKLGVFINGTMVSHDYFYISGGTYDLGTYLACPGAVKFSSYYEDDYYNIDTYRAGDYVAPHKAGQVFGGWYEDAEFTLPLAEDVTEGQAYAKFVDEDVLSVKFQLPIDATETKLRLVTTVDSLKYKKVGFKVEVDGLAKEGDFTSRTVYKTIIGYVDEKNVSYEPTCFSDESAYFMALTFKNIPVEVYEQTITVTPIWQTLDGTTVCGTKRDVYLDVFTAPDFVVEVESGREPIVLQLTDPQIIDASQQRTPDRLNSGEDEYWATHKAEVRCYSYLRETIQNTNPDLIIITGDIIYGEFDDNGTALQTFIEFMDGFGIPWAPIFGNHDNESTKGVDWQCEQFEKAQWCLFKQRELTGNGNYTVGIKQDGELKRVFFMLDSNGCGAASSQSLANGHTVTSTGFGTDQIAWYTETAKSIIAKSPKTKLSFAFHIQLAVFADAYAKYGFDNSTTKEKPINIYTHPDREEGDFGYLGRNLKSAWDTNYAVWNGLKALGVDSILVGHEHCNAASVVYEGVRIQFGQKISTYDRANFLNSDGTIYAGYYGDEDGSRTPLMGGVVMPLSAEDGTIQAPYIYLCGDIDWDSYNKELEDAVVVKGLQYNGSDLYSVDSNIAVTTTTIDSINAYKCEVKAQGKIYVNKDLLKNKSTFTFSILVPEEASVLDSAAAWGEFAIRVKPKEPSSADGSSNGYINFSSTNTGRSEINYTKGTWQTFSIDISGLGTSCTEWAFNLWAGNTYYLKDIFVQ